ncbi:MAG: tellurium resistance protein [Paracoccaceae bacterium]
MAFKPPAPAPKGLWRRTPPAIFPPILGLLGLGLGWRRGAGQFDLPQALPDLLLGAVTLLFLFAAVAFVAKILRRPAVLLEDLRILPGRAGLAAGALSVYLFAGVLGPLAPGLAHGVLLAGLVLHAALIAAVLYVFATGPAEQRRVNPVWHLTFTGPIVAAMVAQGLGEATLAVVLFWVALVAAAGIWLVSLQQFAKSSVPAPLRPLLAIHLAPAALLGTVAAGFGATGLALAFAVLTAGLLAALLMRAGWLLEAGFSPLWGAFTFPLAAVANFWLVLGGAWRLPGGLALVAATVVIPPIAIKVMQLWAKGQLAVKTNAATA